MGNKYGRRVPFAAGIEEKGRQHRRAPKCEFAGLTPLMAQEQEGKAKGVEGILQRQTEKALMAEIDGI
jgi:hypothetical protein